MVETARIRASVQLRENPANNAQNTEALGAGTAVEILTDQGAWVEVKASRSAHPIPGWVPREALAFSPPANDLFPSLPLGSGKTLSSVPPTVKAAEFLDWRNSPGKPGWIENSVWNKFDEDGQKTIADGMRNAVENRQAEWEAWLAAVTANGRSGEAKMEEWFATLEGGRNVWTLRPEMIYKEPSQSQGHLGWAIEDDIMLWSGNVRRNDHEAKYKNWYEVSLYKSGKMLKGWYKADLLDPYIYPREEQDTGIESNKESQFDLQTPLLRHPADPEIQDAVAANRTGYQYIDIVNALGKTKIHHNLCGEFCVAALAGVDVIPLLNQWKAVYPRAVEIMRNNEGTGLHDVRSMFAMFGFTVSEYRYAPSIAPVSPLRLLEQLRANKMAFSGVGIFKSNGRLCGRESGDKTTRHWVVLEDVVPVGNDGWVRIYNPFRNREEVYTFEVFIQSVGQFGIGLWVDMPAG